MSDISSEVLRVFLGVSLPLVALVIHRVLQAVPVFFLGGEIARGPFPRAPVLVQVLQNVQVPICGCAIARERAPSTVVLSRPLQQSYTTPGSSVLTYGVRNFTKKSNDSIVGQRQSFVVVQQAYEMRKPRDVRDRVEVERARVRSGRLGGVPPQLAHQREVDAGLDALHVGEDHGRDIQVRIKGRTAIIELALATPEQHGAAVRGWK